ncbi:hypothetical protein BGX28_009958 [Mortierella sp. GBA30]|nr:hypothetical protein BGX28_009958 [Mortierella sp. GBA30]
MVYGSFAHASAPTGTTTAPEIAQNINNLETYLTDFAERTQANFTAEMLELEGRIVDKVIFALSGQHSRPRAETGQPTRSKTETRPLLDRMTMRASSPAAGSDSETDEPDQIELGSPLDARYTTNHDQARTSRRNDLHDGGDARRGNDSIKKYEGPPFTLSKRKKKFADDWIRKFDNWFRGRVGDPHKTNSNNGDTAIRLVMLAVQNHSTASEWCRTRIRELPLTYIEFMNDFANTFMSLSESHRRLQAKYLQGSPQKKNQSITRYNLKFKKRVDLHRAACLRADVTIDDRALQRSYAAGLFETQHQFRALQQNNLREAMSYMLKKERAHRELTLAKVPSRKKANKDEGSSDSASCSDDSSDENSSDGDIPATSKMTGDKADKDNMPPWESVQNDLKDVTDKIGALTILVTKQQKNYPARAPGPPMTSLPQRDLSRVQCFNCKDYGHLSPNCPKPREQRTLLAQLYHKAETCDDPAGMREYGAFLTMADMDLYRMEQAALQEEQDF